MGHEKCDVVGVATSANSEESRVTGLKNWQDAEEQVLPKNNLSLVFFALLLTTFLVRIFISPFHCKLNPLFLLTGRTRRNDVCFTSESAQSEWFTHVFPV